MCARDGAPKKTPDPFSTFRKRVGKLDPRYLIKCGCCNKKVEIYYGGGTLEINGVLGSAEDWGEILLPLLGARKPRQ